MGLFAHVQMHTVAKHACTVQYRNMATWACDIESAHKDYKLSGCVSVSEARR